MEKILDATNATQYYHKYLKSKNKKLVKRSKIITQQPKSLEISNIVDINQLLQDTEKLLVNYPRQTEKVSQVSDAGKSSDSPLYIETKNNWKILTEENVKITKPIHSFKDWNFEFF